MTGALIASGRYRKEPNFFIGGVSSLIYDKPTFNSNIKYLDGGSKLLQVSVSGNDVEAYLAEIWTNFGYVSRPALASNSLLTYVYDVAGMFNTIQQGTLASVPNLTRVWFPSVTVVNGPSGYQVLSSTGLIGHVEFPSLQQTKNYSFNYSSGIETLYLPQMSSLLIQNEDRTAYSGLTGLNRCYIPNVTTIDYPVSTLCHFSNVKTGCVFYVDPSLETIDGGNRHPLIVYLEDTRLCDIRYVANFTAPNAVSDLSSSNITSNSVDLDFTAATGTNTVEFYEVFALRTDVMEVADMWQNFVPWTEITTTGDTLSGLESGATYKIKIRTCDEYYNRSAFSNEITITTL